MADQGIEEMDYSRENAEKLLKMHALNRQYESLPKEIQPHFDLILKIKEFSIETAIKDQISFNKTKDLVATIENLKKLPPEKQGVPIQSFGNIS